MLKLLSYSSWQQPCHKEPTFTNPVGNLNGPKNILTFDISYLPFTLTQKVASQCSGWWDMYACSGCAPKKEHRLWWLHARCLCGWWALWCSWCSRGSLHTTHSNWTGRWCWLSTHSCCKGCFIDLPVCKNTMYLLHIFIFYQIWSTKFNFQIYKINLHLNIFASEVPWKPFERMIWILSWHDVNLPLLKALKQKGKKYLRQYFNRSNMHIRKFV